MIQEGQRYIIILYRYHERNMVAYLYLSLYILSHIITGVPSGDIRGGWCMTDHNSDFQQVYSSEFDETRLGQLRRSESKSSCSSGSSSNVRVGTSSSEANLIKHNSLQTELIKLNCLRPISISTISAYLIKYFQYSNGSGMYTLADQNYNLAKELPPGWELRFLSTGLFRVLFFNQKVEISAVINVLDNTKY